MKKGREKSGNLRKRGKYLGRLWKGRGSKYKKSAMRYNCGVWMTNI
jgi:hypothetical protein